MEEKKDETKERIEKGIGSPNIKPKKWIEVIERIRSLYHKEKYDLFQEDVLALGPLGTETENGEEVKHEVKDLYELTSFQVQKIKKTIVDGKGNKYDEIPLKEIWQRNPQDLVARIG